MKGAASLLKTIRVFEFHASRPGPTLLIFGAVHGNETCGTEALTKLIGHLETGEIALQKGSLVVVPIANPLAYAEKKRYLKDNLNRIFRPSSAPTSDEARFANILCRLVDRCDAFLDIHSITAAGDPFLYIDFPTPRNRAWAKTMPVHHAIVGWPELYKKMRRLKRAYDSTTYAHKKRKDCLLIECGQHSDIEAPAIAYQAILNSLYHFGLVKGRASRHSYKEIVMKAGYFRQHQKDHFPENWKDHEPIRKGEVLIREANGSVIKAPFDGVIIMPKATAPVGDDWLYLGRVLRP